uniref:Uncharacterized protein n=1 Tax=Eptatretus burgeri TaxID=7764 RepID=A0A8C4PYU8_EPTBU
MWILDYFIHMAKAVFIKGEKYRFQLLYDIMGGVMELPLVICPKMARQLRCLQVMNHCIETPHYEGVDQEKKREKLANEIFELLLRSGIVEDGDTEELRNIQNKFCSPCGLFETWKKQLVQRFLEFNLPSEHEPQLLKAVRCSLEQRLVTKEANDNKTDEPEYSSSDDTNRLARRMIKAAFCSLFDDSQDSLETFEPLKGSDLPHDLMAKSSFAVSSKKNLPVTKRDANTFRHSSSTCPNAINLCTVSLLGLQRSQSPSARPGMEGPSHKKSDRPTNSGVSTPANVLMKEGDEMDLNFSENCVMESPPNVRSSLPEEAAAQSEMASGVAGGQSSNSVGGATKAKRAKPTLSPPVNHTSLVHKDKANLKRMRAGTTSHSVDNLPQSVVKRKIYFDSLSLQQSSLASSSYSSEGLDYLHDEHDFKRMRQRMDTATEEKSTWSDEEANFPATKKTLDLAKGSLDLRGDTMDQGRCADVWNRQMGLDFGLVPFCFTYLCHAQGSLENDEETGH